MNKIWNNDVGIKENQHLVNQKEWDEVKIHD